jgi:hypothetical protein
MKSGSGGLFLGRKYFLLGNRLKALVGNELSKSMHTFAERLALSLVTLFWRSKKK